MFDYQEVIDRSMTFKSVHADINSATHSLPKHKYVRNVGDVCR